MAKNAECIWTGKSGKKYTYESYPIGTKFDKMPGNYIFAKESFAGIGTKSILNAGTEIKTKEYSPEDWSAVYIGQTSDLHERLNNHEEMNASILKGATHIHINKSNSDKEMRMKEEADLIANHSPPCNG